MNFLTIQYFVTVAEELNITRAAERLFISQQSLSKHIIRLEEEVSAELFKRSPSLSLTYAGKCFLKAATRLLDTKRQMIMELDDINNLKRGELRIGISHTRGRVFLPQVLPLFSKKYPLIEIIIKEGNSEALENWLQHGQIDLIIGFSPINLDAAETIDILQESLFAVVPQRYIKELFPGTHEEKIVEFKKGFNLALIKDYPFLILNSGNRIRTLLDHYLNKHGIQVNIKMEMESIESLLSLAGEEMGVTIYPEMFVKHLSPLMLHEQKSPVYFFPIDDPETIGNLVVAYHRDRYLSDAASDFIEMCKTRIRKFYTV